MKTRGNGQGYVRKELNGTYTAIKTKTINGKRKTRQKGGFKTKKAALEYLPQLLFEPKATEAEKVTFAELYHAWSGIHFERISDSKMTAYKIAYKRCERLYDRAWVNISLSEMQAVTDALPSYYTRRDVKQLLSLMGEFAIRNEYTDKNRAQHIQLPPLEAKEKEAFTVEEVKALWRDYESGNTFTGYALIMIYTGMRYGELAGMKKENIDLEQGYMRGGIKSKAGKERIIPISEKIKPVIAEKYAEGKTKLLHMHEDNFRKAFDEMTARAKVRPLKPHSCRHTFCTMLAVAGVQPAVIQKVAGHANYSTTTQYTHIQALSDGLNAVARLEKLIEK